MRRQTVTIWRSAALVVLLNIFFFLRADVPDARVKKNVGGCKNEDHRDVVMCMSFKYQFPLRLGSRLFFFFGEHENFESGTQRKSWISFQYFHLIIFVVNRKWFIFGKKNRPVLVCTGPLFEKNNWLSRPSIHSSISYWLGLSSRAFVGLPSADVVFIEKLLTCCLQSNLPQPVGVGDI